MITRIMTVFRSLISLAFISTHAVAWAGDRSTPSEADVSRGIEYVVVFGIAPNADGKLEACRFLSAYDVSTEEKADFQPSATFITEACAALANGTWQVSREENGEIAEVYMFCMYSNKVPDKPICNVKLSS